MLHVLNFIIFFLNKFIVAQQQVHGMLYWANKTDHEPGGNMKSLDYINPLLQNKPFHPTIS